jgi:hypothetical protein
VPPNCLITGSHNGLIFGPMTGSPSGLINGSHNGLIVGPMTGSPSGLIDDLINGSFCDCFPTNPFFL